MSSATLRAITTRNASTRQLSSPSLFALLGAALVGFLLLDLMRGPVAIPLSGMVAALTGRGQWEEGWIPIIFEIRLPRVITASLAGAGLAVCGLLLQTLLRNPLAGPWAIGVTAGAQVGVALVVVSTGSLAFQFLQYVAWFSRFSLIAGAYIGCTAVLIVILALSRRVSAITLLILGLMASFVAQGLVNIVLHFSNEVQAKVYEAWDTGSFSAVGWNDLSVLIPLLVSGMMAALLLVKPLNTLLLGENYALSVGAAVTRVRAVVLGIVVVIAGSVTAYCGPITFLDLVVPHICRGVFRTANHRVLIPAVILAGAILGLLGDLFASAPWERHFLHVNAVNALIGGPIIAWVILRSRHMRSMGE